MSKLEEMDELRGKAEGQKRTGPRPVKSICERFLTVHQPVLFNSTFEKSVPKLSKNRNAGLILSHARDDKVGIVFIVYVPKEQLHKTARRELLRKHVRDAFARMSVTVRIRRMAHGLVLGLIGEKTTELTVNDVLLGADELQCAGRNTLGALGGVAHDEHRLAQARGLLLYAARVGEDEVARRHEVVEVENLERVDDVQAVEAVQLLVRRLADERVHVDGVDRLGVGVLLHHAADGSEHAVHGLAQVLTAVCRDEDEAGALGPLELGVGVALAHGSAKGVYAGVAGDPDPGLGLALVEQVLLAGLRGCEVVLAHDVDRLAVELLRPGAVDVVRAQAGLDVAHGDLQVEAGERRGETGRGVAVDQDDVGPLALEDGLELEQHVARHVEQRLARLHDRQVVVGSHVEDAQHLVEHLAVLAGHGHDGLELIPARLQLVDERAHLDCLRAGAEDEHDFFHYRSFLMC